jgi:hypothetical protein
MELQKLIHNELAKRESSRLVTKADLDNVFFKLSGKEPIMQKKTSYAIEKKYNGFRAVIHKKGDEVKIFSDQGKDITFPFPTIVSQAKLLSADDFVVDCEFVPYIGSEPQGRSAASKYIGAVKSHKDIDDSDVIFYAFDCLHLGNDLSGKAWSERKKELHSLNFTSNIKETHSVIVNSRDDALKAINMFKDMKGSEGVVIKETDGAYYKNDENSVWIKFRSLLKLNMLVTGVKPVEGDTKARRYSIGVLLAEGESEKINKKNIATFENRSVHTLGNTFNTGIEASVGDVILIMVEEVWRHKSSDGLIRYSLHKPHVIEKADSKETSTINDLDDMVVSTGVEVKQEELADEGSEIGIMPNNFPNRMQKYLNNIMDSGKMMPFVLQWHYRGHTITDEERKRLSIPNDYEYKLDSIHADLRMAVNDHLEGITLLSPTTTDESVPDNIQKGKLKNVRAVLKAPQPKQWLTVNGFMPRGEPGTTAKSPAYFIGIAAGKYAPCVVEDHSIIIETESIAGSIPINQIKENLKKHKLYITRFPGDNLRDLPKYIQFQIAHIGDKHILLVNERAKIES